MKLLLSSVLLFSYACQAQLVPPDSTGVAMGHVHLNVTDVAVQQKFWADIFCGTPFQHDVLPCVKVPGMLIVLTKRNPTGPSEGSVVDHFGFKVRSVADILLKANTAGYKTLPIFKGTEGFPNAYVIGPDGVKVELQEDTSQQQAAVAHHIHYYVKDTLGLREWYEKNFSVKPRKHGSLDSADIPGINLTYSPIQEDARPGTKGRALDHIGFEIKNLEEFCKKLEANGVKLDVPYRKMPNLGVALAFVTDP